MKSINLFPRAAIPLAIGAAGHELYSSRTQTLFSSIFDRLERYPILLKETSRYYEDPHPDRSAIHQAMQIYSEIFHRCKLLRKLRKEDIEVLSSDIRGFSDQMRAQFADPTLTLRALLCSFGHDGKFLPEAAQPEAVVLLYPNSVIFLSVCSDSPKAYQFRVRSVFISFGLALGYNCLHFTFNFSVQSLKQCSYFWLPVYGPFN